MTRALKLSPEARSNTITVARELGRVFRAERLARGDQQKHVAYRAGVKREVVSRFERGHVGNPALGNIVRMLDVYGLTIIAARRTA